MESASLVFTEQKEKGISVSQGTLGEEEKVSIACSTVICRAVTYKIVRNN